MSKKTIAIVVAASVVVLLGVVVWWLFNTGRLVYVASGTKAPAGVVVCGTDMVTKYNNATELIKRQGSDTASIDKDALSSLATDIRNKQAYKDDPTCQTILFWVAFRNEDKDAAEASMKTLEELHEKRQFADSNLRNSDAFANRKTYLNVLSGSDDQNEDVQGE